MRKLRHNNHADLNMILTAIIVAITLAISVLVVLNVLGAISPGDIDSDVATAAGRNTTLDTAATNATESLQTNIETFYTVAPIVLIVIAAVGILGYVMLLRRGK